MKSLLPVNRTRLEDAAAGAIGAMLPGSIPVGQAFDPAQAPASFLPWLAVHNGVKLWYSDWSEARKRSIIADQTLNWSIGTRSGAQRYLAYVDGVILDAVSYPTRCIAGRAILARTPLNHPPFVARYLVKVETPAIPNAGVAGRAIGGRRVLRQPGREKTERAMAALRVAKAPDTQIRVDFTHQRMIRLSDNIPLDGSYRLGQFKPRNRM